MPGKRSAPIRDRRDRAMYKSCIKRMLDILLSLAGLILASWLYLLIMIAIEIDDPGLPSGIRMICWRSGTNTVPTM